MTTEIRCADCRERRLARNRNTRYCHRCRLLRNIEYFMLAHRHRVCSEAGCTRTYAPVDRADAHCGKHALGYSTLKGECGLCKGEDTFLIREGVNLCIVCVRDPAQRRRLVGILQRSQARRRAENAVVVTQHHTPTI